MRHLSFFVPALALALIGCGGPDGDPAAAPSSGSSPAASSAAPSGTPTQPPSASPTVVPTTAPATKSAKLSTQVRDCRDGDCRLLVSKPVTIPLDTKRFYYPSITVTEVTRESLTYQVRYPHGGGAVQRLSPGNKGGFGFRSYTHLEVALERTSQGRLVLVISPAPAG